MEMLAKRFSMGPFWVFEMAFSRAAIAAFPDFVLGAMKPSEMSSWG
jgi:hypothetical protein